VGGPPVADAVSGVVAVERAAPVRLPPSLYDVLGVSSDARAEEIRRAFRALALRYHPDLYAGPDAGARFREISDAYRVLNDPESRARYDHSTSSRSPAARASRGTWEPSFRAQPRPDVPRFLDERPRGWIDERPRWLLDERPRWLLDERPRGWVVVIERGDWG
jgi:hypothetical protein